MPQSPQAIAPPEESKSDTNTVTIVAASAAGVVVLSILMLIVWHVRKDKVQIVVKPALVTPTASLFQASLYQPCQMPFSGTLTQLSQFPTQRFQQGTMQRPSYFSQTPIQPFQQGSMRHSTHLPQFLTQPFQQGSISRPRLG